MRPSRRSPASSSTPASKRTDHGIFRALIDAPEDVPLIFPTKVDAWLIVILVASFTFAMFVVTAAAREAHTWIDILTLLLGSAGPALIIALVAVPTHYELHADRLVVRPGIIRYRAEYRDIRSVVPSHAVWSAPAWSLDRLWISRESGRDLLISPREKERFLVELQ